MNSSPEDHILLLRKRILQAVVPHVAFDGWTERALRHALADAGLTGFDATRAFPGGMAEIVEAYGTEADTRMREAAALAPFAEMRVRDRIAYAIEARLAGYAAERETLSRTMAFYALPQHAVAGMRALYRTVDTIWRLAGDRSNDFNFYTKRGLLAWVYSTTLCAFLADRSEGCADTKAFLHRRIEEVMTAGKWLGRVIPRA